MKKVILFIFLIFILLSIIIVIFILNKPGKQLTAEEKQAAYTKIAGRQLNLTGKYEAQGDVQYKGKYSSYLYPKAAKIYTQMVNGQKVDNKYALDFFEFDLDDPKVYVVTEVSNATSSINALTDIPGVGLRLSQPDLYIKSTVTTSQGDSGLAFSKSDSNGYEKTMFILKNRKIYSFSIISVDNKKIEEIFNKLLTTLSLFN